MYHQLTRKIIDPSNLPYQPRVFRFLGPTQWRGAGRLKRNRFAPIFKCNTQIKIGFRQIGHDGQGFIKTFNSLLVIVFILEGDAQVIISLCVFYFSRNGFAITEYCLVCLPCFNTIMPKLLWDFV